MNTDLLRPAVATVPTVYGIETCCCSLQQMHLCRVATVPTVYGIETCNQSPPLLTFFVAVATVPTVYGIETLLRFLRGIS